VAAVTRLGTDDWSSASEHRRRTPTGYSREIFSFNNTIHWTLHSSLFGKQLLVPMWRPEYALLFVTHVTLRIITTCYNKICLLCSQSNTSVTSTRRKLRILRDQAYANSYIVNSLNEITISEIEDKI
jgi:hypothetical protein